MKFEEYVQHDGLGLAQQIRDGEVTPEELVAVAIERIEATNPRLNVMVERLFDEARERAAEHEPGEGAFDGVPFLIKDMVARAGTPLSLGSRFLHQARFKPPKSHEVVRRAEGSGLRVLGTTNAPEFGLLPITEPRAFGATANPWHLEHSPGGSSGGSASAVAAGIVPMAHGNDGGGSIRIPAANCGLFGLKPSRGRNPGSPEDLPSGLPVEHVLTRSVRDSAALLDITRGPLPGDRWWAPDPEEPYLSAIERDPRPLRVAFSTRDFSGRRAHPDCVAAVENTARLLEDLGHHVEEAAPKVPQDAFDAAFVALWEGMAGSLLLAFMREARGTNRWIDRTARLFGEKRVLEGVTRLLARVPDRRAPLETATCIGAASGLRRLHVDVQAAQMVLHRATLELARFLTDDCDLWLTPVLSAPPLKTGALDGLPYDAIKERVLRYACFTPIANSSGNPGMSVPLHWNDDGLPIGVQFIAPYGDETTLFRLAAQLERAQPWFDKRPKV